MVPRSEGEKKNDFGHVWEVSLTLNAKYFFLLKTKYNF